MDSFCKYTAALMLVSSVFALVWIGKVDAQVYVGLVSSALAGLGYHAATNLGKPSTSSPLPNGSGGTGGAGQPTT